MPRKIIWVIIILGIAWVWSSTVMKSCSSDLTKSTLSGLDKENSKDEPLFEAKTNRKGNDDLEDIDDEEYIASNSDDGPDEEDIIKDRASDSKVKKAADKLKETKESVVSSTKKVIEEPAEKVKAIKDGAVAKAETIKKQIKSSQDEAKKILEEETLSKGEDSNRSWLVVVGSFNNELNAQVRVNELKAKGYRNAEKVIFDFSKYHSVIVGRYKSEASARAKELELKNKGVEAYIHKMRSRFYEE